MESWIDAEEFENLNYNPCLILSKLHFYYNSTLYTISLVKLLIDNWVRTFKLFDKICVKIIIIHTSNKFCNLLYSKVDNYSIS